MTNDALQTEKFVCVLTHQIVIQVLLGVKPQGLPSWRPGILDLHARTRLLQLKKKSSFEICISLLFKETLKGGYKDKHGLFLEMALFNFFLVLV